MSTPHPSARGMAYLLSACFSDIVAGGGGMIGAYVCGKKAELKLLLIAVFTLGILGLCRANIGCVGF
ncbi:hypothetical protein GCM10022198_19710 [Klugiella xanthotipulae]